MKKLGFGAMRLPVKDWSDQTTIDIEQAKKMVDMFLERGFTYFDTAWMYHNFKSENAIKEILVDRYPRDAYTLATKLHAGYIEKEEDADGILKAQMEKTGVDYFDYYLLHDLNGQYYEKYTKLGCFEWIKQKKEEKVFGKIGFSFHDRPEVLDQILSEHPDFDFVQLQINYLDWESPAIQSKKCYEVARKHGMSIMIMEPVKGGILAILPKEALKVLKSIHPDWSEAEWAIKYAAGLEGVIMVLSGMSSLEQMDDNTRFMSDFKALTEEENKALQKCTDIINSDISIPCTGCSYCTDGCAEGIPIPMYFSLYNIEKKAGRQLFSIQSEYYDNISSKKAKASECIECGQCELICPQHLPVIKNLKAVAELFEKK